MIIFRQYIWRVRNFKYAEYIGNIALSVLGPGPHHLLVKGEKQNPCNKRTKISINLQLNDAHCLLVSGRW